MSPLILRLDITGTPRAWIPWQNAVCLHARDMIAWTAGDSSFSFNGGICRRTGERSIVTIQSIIAVKRSHSRNGHKRTRPPLSNRELFLRDGHLCMYCGKETSERLLTRDHLLPLSRGGHDRWSNVVAACKSCNNAKGSLTLEESGMQLLAVPYVPNWAEYLALSNRRILADQMQFLKTQFRKNSRLHIMQ